MMFVDMMEEADYRRLIQSSKITYLAKLNPDSPLGYIAVYSFPHDGIIATNGAIFLEESTSESLEADDYELHFLESNSERISRELQQRLGKILPGYSFGVEKNPGYALELHDRLVREIDDEPDHLPVRTSKFTNLKIARDGRHIGTVDMTGYGYMHGFILVDLGWMHGYRREIAAQEATVQALKEDVKIVTFALDNILQIMSGEMIPEISYSNVRLKPIPNEESNPYEQIIERIIKMGK